MIPYITYATTNIDDFSDAYEFFRSKQIKLTQDASRIEKIQNLDIQKIVEYSAQYASILLETAVFTSEKALHIECLNGFPGTLFIPVSKYLTTQDISKLLPNTPSSAYFEIAIACSLNKNDLTIFKSKSYGTISKPENIQVTRKIKNPFYYLFTPQNSNKPLSEYTSQEMTDYFNTAECLKDLYKHLKLAKI